MSHITGKAEYFDTKINYTILIIVIIFIVITERLITYLNEALTY